MSLIGQLLIELINLPYRLKATRRSDTMTSGAMLIVRREKIAITISQLLFYLFCIQLTLRLDTILIFMRHKT